jgi:hypothetical protein
MQKQADAKVKAPDVGPAKKAVDDLNKELEETARRSEEASFQGAVMREAYIDAAHSLREAGAGALQAARGVAFLTAAGEDELKVMLKYVAVAQGVYDVLQGGFSVVSGLTNAYKSWTGATNASAAANALLTASLGPVGWAIAGITAAIAAASVAYAALADDAEMSAEKQLRARERLRPRPSGTTHRAQSKAFAETLARVQANRRFGRIGIGGEQAFQADLQEDIGVVESMRPGAGRDALLQRMQQAVVESQRAELEMLQSFDEFSRTNLANQERLKDQITEAEAELARLQY